MAYTREEASKIKSEFWKKYGQFMAPVPSADWDNEKVNWVNYKTGIRSILFRLEADKKSAFVGIYIVAEEAVQLEIYSLLEGFTSKESAFKNWKWELQEHDNQYGIITKFTTSIVDVNIFMPETWPKLISFFKSNMILLDEFWSNYKYAFEPFKYR